MAETSALLSSAMGVGSSSSEYLSGDGDGDDNDIQSVLISLNQCAANFKSMSKRLQDELDRLKLLIKQKEAELVASNMMIRQHEEKMAEMQEEIDAQSKEIEALKAENAMLREKEKELEATKVVVRQLEEKIAEMQGQMDAQSKEIEALNEKAELLKEREKELEASNMVIRQNEEKMAEMQGEMDAQSKEIEDLKAENARLKEKEKELEASKLVIRQNEEKMAEMQGEMDAQSKEIEDLKAKDEDWSNQVMVLRGSNEAQQKKMEAQKEEYEEKMQGMADEQNAINQALQSKTAAFEEKEKELADILAENAGLREALAEAERKLEEILNRPRKHQGMQTEMTGDDIGKVAALAKENKELKKLVTMNDDRLVQLVNENEELLNEIDSLLKQQAQFRPDTSNHSGEILAMCVAPNTYTVATTAADKSVRLWLIDPKESKARQIVPWKRSQMEGIALSLAFTRDGTHLVAGCAYKNGPEGLLIVWNMEEKDGEVKRLFRSRPSVRFGRAHAVRCSDDGRYIFSGDTTGSIWVWDMEHQVQLAEIHGHSDVVHDIQCVGSNLFTCALDQTIAVLDLDKMESKLRQRRRSSKRSSKKLVKLNSASMSSLKKKDLSKIHVKRLAVKMKAEQIQRNDKYPFWVLDTTEDGATLVAGSRKINIWRTSGLGSDDDSKAQDGAEKLVKGPVVTDSDLEHVQSLQVKKGQIVICRRDVSRAKIFSAEDGKEVTKSSKYKTAVKRVQFTYDSQHCVVCCQKGEGGKAKPPSMHLWNIKK